MQGYEKKVNSAKQSTGFENVYFTLNYQSLSYDLNFFLQKLMYFCDKEMKNVFSLLVMLYADRYTSNTASVK